MQQAQRSAPLHVRTAFLLAVKEKEIPLLSDGE